MSATHTALSQEPPSHPGRVSAVAGIFGLLGGPLAWFAQLCAGYALASWACFPKDQRRLVPADAYAWTWNAMIVVSIAAFVVALIAFLVSRRLHLRTRDERAVHHDQVLEAGRGRTHFLALWGMLAGGGFAVAVAFTGVFLIVLPRCAG